MKYNNLLLLFALSLFFSQKTKAQSNTAIDSIQFKNVVEEMPSFTIFGDNYIISGTTLGQTPNSNNSDAKMQIGFKQMLLYLGTLFCFLPTNKRLFGTFIKNHYPLEKQIIILDWQLLNLFLRMES
jgi:hypothetical protein